MYPEHLKEQYWAEVATLVSNVNVGDSRTQISDDDIRGAIAEFRDRLSFHEAGDLIYHQDSAITAQSIRSVISIGLPDPEALRLAAVAAAKQLA
jgi:hypothetical protein